MASSTSGSLPSVLNPPFGARQKVTNPATVYGKRVGRRGKATKEQEHEDSNSAYILASSTWGSPPSGLSAPPRVARRRVGNPVTVYGQPVARSGKATKEQEQGYPRYSVVRRFFAFVFAWMTSAAFVALPGWLNTLNQSHPTWEIVKKVSHSIQNIPLLVLSCVFGLVGIVGVFAVSWKYMYVQDHDWLFHEFYRPMASGGFFGVVSTMEKIYTTQNGKYSTSNIATLAVMSSIGIIFSMFALNSYRHINPKDASFNA